MPIYEYTCKSCEQKVEILVRTYEEKNLACPHCGSDRLEKLWSVPGVITGTQPDRLPYCGRKGMCDIPGCPARAKEVCGENQ